MGLQAKSIAKKKQRLEPVLEKYQFVPNCTSLTLSDSIRVITQIIIENSLDSHFKSVEILDESTPSDFLSPLFCKALDDVPVITPNVIISTKKTFDEIPGVKFEDFVLTPQSNLLVIIGTKLLQRPTIPKLYFQALSQKGYFISRESRNFHSENTENLEILTEFMTSNEKIIMFRKSNPLSSTKYIEIKPQSFEWLPELQKAKKSEDLVVAFSQNQDPEGILGLVNCLRPEPSGSKVRCLFMMDPAPVFDPQNPFYFNQIKKNLAINVYKDGKWGTYRHLHLEELGEVESEHCYANVTVRGELASMKWLEGPLRHDSVIKKGHVMIIVS